MAVNKGQEKTSYSLFLVSGNCMSPLIRDGDVVITIPVPAPRAGDILAISGPSPVVHRLLKITDDGLIQTKADATWTLDPPSTRDDIQGKVIAIIRKKSKPVLMDGWLWRMVNFLIAGYSLFCLQVSYIMPKHKAMTNFKGWVSSLSTYGIGVALKIVAGLTGNRSGKC